MIPRPLELPLPTLPATIRIETPDETFLSTTEVNVPRECTVTDDQGQTHHLEEFSALCALDTAAMAEGFSYTVQEYSFGLLLTGIGPYVAGEYDWLYRVNWVSPSIGMDDYELSAADELLLSFTHWPDFPLRLTVSESSLKIQEPLTITAEYYHDGQEQFVPAPDARVSIGGGCQEMNAEGTLDWSFNAPGVVELYLEQDAYTRSPRVMVTTEDVPGKDVNVRIEGPDGPWWNGQVTVNTTVFEDDSGIRHFIDHPSPLGAVIAVAQEQAWDGSIACEEEICRVLSLRGITADEKMEWWTRTNWQLEDTMTTLLNHHDTVLLGFSESPAQPLRLMSDHQDWTSDDEIIVSVEAYIDERDAWSPVSGATVRDQSSAQGVVTLHLDPGEYDLVAEGGGWIRSVSVPIHVALPPAPPGSPSPTPRDQTALTRAAEQGLAYLRGIQQSDGTMENIGTSAWAAMAFTAMKVAPSDVGLLTDVLQRNLPTESAPLTSWERTVLAFVASSIDPTNVQGVDLVQKIKSAFDGAQIGSSFQLNDDLFGLLALDAAGLSRADSLIVQTRTWVAAHQNADGGFSFSIPGKSDTDTTAAALQALAATGGVPKDLHDRALAYVHTTQQTDGGFGYSTEIPRSNTASTAWAVQALVAVDEDPFLWTVNANDPFDFLLTQQQASGGMMWQSGEDPSGLMTAYAVLAFAQATLPVQPASTTPPPPPSAPTSNPPSPSSSNETSDQSADPEAEEDEGESPEPLSSQTEPLVESPSIPPVIANTDRSPTTEQDHKKSASSIVDREQEEPQVRMMSVDADQEKILQVDVPKLSLPSSSSPLPLRPWSWTLLANAVLFLVLFGCRWLVRWVRSL
jgi:hypothetical protein